MPELLIDQQMALRNVMQMEYQYLQLGEALVEHDKVHANTIALINNVPCILHLENRIGIKKFWHCCPKGTQPGSQQKSFPQYQ